MNEKRQKRKKCRRFRWSGEEQRVEIWVRRPDYKRCFTVEKWGGTPFQCQHSNEDAPKDIGPGLFLLLSDRRGRGTLISWEDMVCITEITEGQNLSTSCVYVWEPGIRCDHKTLLIQTSLFKRHISLTCSPGKPTPATPASPYRRHRIIQMRICLWILCVYL